jgi:transketolase
LLEAAAENTRIWVVCGDLGFSVLEPFAASFPDRFVNAGVAEQDMTGIAAGIALSGDIAVTYSIANFPVLRCLEQVRNDVCYHNLSVVVVAVGGGYSYGSAGFTHHGTEDLTIMRALPGMSVVAPGDPNEARLATRQALALEGPCYLRLGRAGETPVHAREPEVPPGTIIPVREGRDALVVTTGSVLAEAVRAADIVAQHGYSLAVWSCPWLTPLDRKALSKALHEFPLVATAEEGVVTGGLGSAVSTVYSELSCSRAVLRMIGLEPSTMSDAFSQNTGRSRVGLDATGIAETVMLGLSSDRERSTDD